MTKKIFPLLFFILLTNCTRDDQKNISSEANESEDALPQISISEIDDLVEKRTNFRVSISGINEQTNTTVLINDDEVVSTNQKDFDIEVNPFDYPNGKTVLTVKSVASNNQESIENQEFEIKKLLFRSYGGLSSESVDSYLAINLQSTGELVAFKKIITYDDPIFFHAEDNFIEENIIVTQYDLSNNTGLQLARIYGNVEPGTELISTQEVADELGLDYIMSNNDSSFDLTIEGTSNSGLFTLFGRSYNFDSSTFPNFEINYDGELTTDVFLYYLDPSNDDLLDNYRYTFIDNLTNQTLQFDEMSLLQPDDIFTIDLPQTVEKAVVNLLGYTDENDYREDMYKLLFGKGIETATAGYSVNFPVLEEYPIIVKSINLEFLDGKKVLFNQRGNPDITIPNLTIQENDGTIVINGDYDFSELNLGVSHPDPESNDVFRMIYKNQHLDSIEIPFKSLQIPGEIVQFLNGKGFEVDIKNNTGQMDLRLSKYENKVFPNGVFYSPLRREFGDAVYWTSPLQN